MEYLSLAQFSELNSMWCTQFEWHMHFGSAPCDAHTAFGELCSLFLLYRELFSDQELFTDTELREART